MTTLTLRPYQVEALDAVTGAWAGGMKRPAAVLATGLGKTVIFAELARRAAESGRRPFVLVHRDELVRQTVAKLHAVAPSMSIGVVKAERDEHDKDMVVASAQTLGRRSRLDRLPRNAAGLVIIDECHHAAADSYTRIMDHFGCFDQGVDINAVGFTATMDRGDKRALGAVWQEVVFTRDTLYGISNGYLTDVKGFQVTVGGLNLAEVARSRGDYQDGDLGDAMIASGAGEVTANAYREQATLDDGTLRQGILFAPTVASARGFAEALNDEKITTEVITGETTTDDRRDIYGRAIEHRTTVLASCMVLTEGFDMPQMSCAVIARPTSREALYAQMVGRVLRPSPGKRDALVIDVAGVSSKLALATLATLAPPDLDDIEVEPGETLFEAIERVMKHREAMGLKPIEGITEIQEVDLFKNSTSAWLTTKGGVWFIPTQAGYVFLSPDNRPDAAPGTWLIGKTADQYRKAGRPSVRYALGSSVEIHPQHWGWVRGDGLGLEYTMAFAERVAQELDPTVSSRTASWRAGRNAPSDAQRGLAARLGIEVPEGMTRSALSDAMSTHYASKILDRRV